MTKANKTQHWYLPNPKSTYINVICSDHSLALTTNILKSFTFLGKLLQLLIGIHCTHFTFFATGTGKMRAWYFHLRSSWNRIKIVFINNPNLIFTLKKSCIHLCLLLSCSASLTFASESPSTASNQRINAFSLPLLPCHQAWGTATFWVELPCPSCIHMTTSAPIIFWLYFELLFT